jgi:hypothetical protein
MSDTREFELAVDRWLDDGTDTSPSEVIDAVLLAARSTPQERDLRVPWRTPAMKLLTLGAGTAAAIAIALVGAQLLGSPGDVGSSEQPATPTPSRIEPSPSASAAFGTLPRECAEIEAGIYRAAIGPASITMSVPAGWSGRNNGTPLPNGKSSNMPNIFCRRSPQHGRKAMK